jgi:hypothetical protein
MRNLLSIRSRKMRSVVLVGTVWLVLVFSPSVSIAQCALCRDALEGSSPQTREMMNYAILGLAAAPYGVAAAAALLLSPRLRDRLRSGLRGLGFKRFGSSP